MEAVERAKRRSDGDGYNRYITDELNSFRKEAWKKQIGKHLNSKCMDILDVGTGPGFFACILSEEGHNVTGIDASDGMLQHAAENARRLDVHPVFRKMDVNHLDIPNDSFDLVISRNVTWTLEHPEKVYSEFKRVLRPGGKILIYDANWHMHFFDKDLMDRVKKHEEDYFKKYGKREVISSGDMDYLNTAPLTSIIRPDWDNKVLTSLGMEVTIQTDVGSFVYEEWEKELYQESPLFEICAVKKAREERAEKMHTYWQERSETFGFDILSVQRVMAKVRPFIEEDGCKVLDVGTGTGMIAAAFASLGCKVTAVDLCINMIEKAKQNLADNNLNAEFIVTQADELPFEDNSFDMVVNRNVTWALPEPEKTLKQWARVLKPGGILLYFDGNHYNYLFKEEARRDRDLMIKIKGTAHDERSDKAVDYSLCDNTAYELPLSKLERPHEWDEAELPKAGFVIIKEDIDMPQNLLKFGIARGSANQFMIVAKNLKEK